MEFQSLAKYASIIVRGGNRFFGQELEAYGIGWGQQYFLWIISENQGIAMCDLAQKGFFDKATVTRAIQKLSDSGYIISKVDEKDRRIRRLQTTAAAEPLLQYLGQLRKEWNELLTSGLSPGEIEQAIVLMGKIAENAMKKRMENNL